MSVTVALGNRRALGTEQVVSSIPGSVGYTSYPMFIEPTITYVPSEFSGYIWLDTKIVFKNMIPDPNHVITQKYMKETNADL